jgi:hypothetical protein
MATHNNVPTILNVITETGTRQATAWIISAAEFEAGYAAET